MNEVAAPDIVVEVEVPGEQDRVWAALTTEAALSTWLAEDARVGARVGDPFELFWDTRNPEINSTIGCRVLESEEPRRLAIEWKGPVLFASIMNSDPLPTRVRFDLSPGGGDTTVLRLRHEGWRSPPEWQEARAWHQSVWGGALEQLRTWLSNPHGAALRAPGERRRDSRSPHAGSRGPGGRFFSRPSTASSDMTAIGKTFGRSDDHYLEGPL